MSSKPLLVLHTERRNGVALIAFEGDIDSASVQLLEDALASVERNGTKGILLDFGRLAFIDSTGLHWIDRAHRRAVTSGWTIAVSNDSRAVRRTFEMAGMDRLLNSQSAGDLLERFSSNGGNGDHA